MEKKLGKMFSGFKKGLLLFTVLMLIALPSSVFAGDPKIKTMTRNLYLGADSFKVVEAAQTDPDSIPYAVADVYQTMLYTNFWERAEALADEIALFEPDVIGLQEVFTYYIQTPGDFIFGNPVQANTVVIDFYSVLDAALQMRGMDYTAFTVTNADIEMPMADLNAGPPYYLSDIRLVDHDVILVREDHVASNEYKGNYQYQLELDLGGTSVAFTRGYIALDVNIKGDDFRFVNTHLEVRSAPGSVFRVFQAAQMEELLGTIDYLSGLFDSKPVVMVGDFNSSSEDVPGESYVPDGQGGYVLMPYVPPYMMAIDAGYKDSWLEQKKYGDSFTSGFDEYVSDPTAELTSRIDLIFLDPKDLEIDKVKARVVGNKVEDMTPSGFWPSDHAGVVAKVKFDGEFKLQVHHE
ncbi:MAG: endonuclease/exonuclease/phosphatase family protein [Deltaproteobacteria bacterium]|jgi:hypothetical protein|nr:endonuclease/exonuclease/phosphatase family protein [Deltaproteobacteria bacterium]MDL1986439.1 endonuclease/exonuclease/phosphatase family protein [Deltaproteobacteria bacterium]MDL2124873.1 endonuclease/exonuclease/phosphatase family protein [Deltaproteobacteria bacterium]